MTAKEILRDYVETMDEDEAEQMLDLLFRYPVHEPPPLTPEQIGAINEGRRQAREGLGIPHEDLMRELGIPGDDEFS